MNDNMIGKFLFLFTGLIFLSGCSTSFQDFTPERIPQNPSGIYTFSFSVSLPKSTRIAGTERAELVINGETIPMQKVGSDPLSFSGDYRMPGSISEARYYYVVYWDYRVAGEVKTAARYSTAETGKLYQARLINRYPIQIVSDRGPVGSRIPIVGSGFSSTDTVVVGGTEALTTVHSANSLDFVIPPMPAGRSYAVALRTGSGDLPVGNLRVDQAALSVQPTELFLSVGSTDFLIIETDNAAPAGGLYIETQTDLPEALIVPEIVIPEGARSVNVNISADRPGSGVLVLSVPGYAPVNIPVTVN
ncbi:MAG: hypothetical protein RL648_265 [Verrucomicrobiota bacterium]